MLAVAASIVIVPLTVAASIQTTYWQNSETLWRHTLACTSQNYVAHTDLGSALVKEGRISEAMEQYQIALGINPQYLEANNNIGILLARQGQTAEAIGYYQKALEANPDFVEAHVNLGNALSAAGQIDEATEHFEKALQLDPNQAEAHNNWGTMLLARGQAAAAVDHFETAIETQSRVCRGAKQPGQRPGVAEGQTATALTHYQKAIVLKPGYANAHYNLANLYAAQGRFDEAIAQYQTALELMPNFVKAHYQLGLARARQQEISLKRPSNFKACSISMLDRSEPSMTWPGCWRPVHRKQRATATARSHWPQRLNSSPTTNHRRF